MSLNDCLIIIPAYNEEQAIAAVLTGLHQVGFTNILVVNDGSSDSTKAVAIDNSAFVISHTINLGFGAAVKSGFAYAVESKKYKYAVTCDADGQHLPEDVKRVAEELVATAAFENSVINGSRQYDNNMPRYKCVTNFLADLFTFLFSGKFVHDTQSGLKGMPISIINRLKLDSDDYALCSEIILKATSNGFKVVEIPIKTIYTSYSQHSQAKGTRQGLGNSLKMVKKLLS